MPSESILIGPIDENSRWHNYLQPQFVYLFFISEIDQYAIFYFYIIFINIPSVSACHHTR
jgi:hypothetical protein